MSGEEKIIPVYEEQSRRVSVWAVVLTILATVALFALFHDGDRSTPRTPPSPAQKR